MCKSIAVRQGQEQESLIAEAPRDGARVARTSSTAAVEALWSRLEPITVTEQRNKSLV